MGAGALQKIHSEREAETFSTSLKLLALLEQNHPDPMTTYQMGLWVQDNQNPPRPISIIVKTLAQDGLITRFSSAGKRSVHWIISPQGLASAKKRAAEIKMASIWIAENPHLNPLEGFILRRLLQLPAATPRILASEHSSQPSPIRTALKRLAMRGFIASTTIPHGGCKITPQGRSVAKLQLLQERDPDEAHASSKLPSGLFI